jgi:hypothetical protein
MDKTIKYAREVVADINHAGEQIYSHLADEPELNSARQQILLQNAGKADIECAIQVHCTRATDLLLFVDCRTIAAASR